MKIVFNNGKELFITQDIGNILNERILEGAKQWQTFTNGSTGKVVLMVNLSEVSYVSEI